jgi:hypothetical protein
MIYSREYVQVRNERLAKSIQADLELIIGYITTFLLNVMVLSLLIASYLLIMPLKMFLKQN